MSSDEERLAAAAAFGRSCAEKTTKQLREMFGAQLDDPVCQERVARALRLAIEERHLAADRCPLLDELTSRRAHILAAFQAFPDAYAYQKGLNGVALMMDVLRPPSAPKPLGDE